MSIPKISVILPTYNEKENVQTLISEIFDYLKEDVEVIVIDDASPDGTAERAQEITQKNEYMRILKREKKLGVASAISAGISLARGEIIAWMDADFSMPPGLLPEMVASLSEYDIAVGSRYAKGGSDKRGLPVRKFTSKAVNRLASFLLNKHRMMDFTSGFIAAHRRVCDTIPIRGTGGEYCIDFLYNAILRGFKIVEIPYECSPRKSGSSKVASDLFSLLRNGIRYCITIFSLRSKKDCAG